MRITTEASLRRIVRRIISEVKNTQENVAITNSMRTTITVVGVYADTDTVKAANLLPAPVEIAAADAEFVAFTPTTDDTAFKIIATRYQGSGVTPGYSRGQLSVAYTIGDGTAKFDVLSTGAAPGSNYIDDTEMATTAIDDLVKPGEEYEIMDDPTDADFKYAVFYVKTPTRAVVIRAPTADYKGKKIVSSMGEEISPRRYGGSFKKIADAFVEKMKTP
jgi:hypothetical protein